jgi:hypothetical protein
LCAAQRVRNASLWVASSPTRSERSRSCGSRAGGPAQDGDAVVGGAVPVAVEGLGSRLEEDEPGVVDRPGGRSVQLGEQGASELVCGEDVEALVAYELDGPLDVGSDALLGLASTSPCRRWLCGSGEVEEVGVLSVVELKRVGQRLEDAPGDPVHVAALEAGVVGDADTGQYGDLLAAQSRNAARAVGR